MNENIISKLKEAFEETPEVSVNIPNFIDEEKHKLIINLVAHAMNHLGIDNIPDIIFLKERSDVPMTTGSYIPQENIIYILAGNRAICDYLRTLAHELTHFKQQMEGRIPNDLQGRDQELEAEANTEAGNIIYDFAHSNDENQAIYDF